jgi:hypothetical protein
MGIKTGLPRAKDLSSYKIRGRIRGNIDGRNG